MSGGLFTGAPRAGPVVVDAVRLAPAHLETAKLGIHYRGVQWEGGTVDGGSII